MFSATCDWFCTDGSHINTFLRYLMLKRSRRSRKLMRHSFAPLLSPSHEREAGGPENFLSLAACSINQSINYFADHNKLLTLTITPKLALNTLTHHTDYVIDSYLFEINNTLNY